MTLEESILILDFGSQYSQLIARRVREAQVYSEIVPFDIRAEEVRRRAPKGIILSGGPRSVYETGAPRLDPAILDAGVPVLGICYGLQVGCLSLGARVGPAVDREYGRTVCDILDSSDLLSGLGDRMVVWMSHGDQVAELSGDFLPLARTENCPYAAVRHRTRAFYGLQFHPEVTHTPEGGGILANFLFRICGAGGKWKMSSFLDRAAGLVRSQVGAGAVVCALSGGVDSAVTAALVHRAVGDRLQCVFVDNGLLRKGEPETVDSTFRELLGVPLHHVKAADRFLGALAGVVDPEEKRKRIGRVFIEVFEEVARRIEGVGFLAQGTLYPDWIESTSPTGGPSAKIKSHHNVGGLPERLGLALVEPLRYLFKDEVRSLGTELGLPDAIVWRQPFPGPGLAVRILGEVTPDRLAILREADHVVREEVERADLERKYWQAFAVLLPVRSVGIKGDQRSYEMTIAVRVVESTDGMTADWARLPYGTLERIANRIPNEVSGINRVVYDVTSKPPATIEWE